MFVIMVPDPLKLIIVQAKCPLVTGKRGERFNRSAGSQQARARERTSQFEKIAAGEMRGGVVRHKFVFNIPAAKYISLNPAGAGFNVQLKS